MPNKKMSNKTIKNEPPKGMVIPPGFIAVDRADFDPNDKKKYSGYKGVITYATVPTADFLSGKYIEDICGEKFTEEEEKLNMSRHWKKEKCLTTATWKSGDMTVTATKDGISETETVPETKKETTPAFEEEIADDWAVIEPDNIVIDNVVVDASQFQAAGLSELDTEINEQQQQRRKPSWKSAGTCETIWRGQTIPGFLTCERGGFSRTIDDETTHYEYESDGDVFEIGVDPNFPPSPTSSSDDEENMGTLV